MWIFVKLRQYQPEFICVCTRNSEEVVKGSRQDTLGF